ncbi:hypothetical protein [Aggregatilinea lenta]|uniref:hypothetical protein n=1 Tax=Aggregatilinea lenta TaxID=913108 RepID=UPI000E5BD6D4|nr:hypothetical protein [Aggregatilinea lenta]
MRIVTRARLIPARFLRRFLFVLLVAASVSGHFDIAPSIAQRFAPDTFYAVTWNIATMTTIWEVDLPRDEIREVLTLNYYDSITLRESLSEHELAAFNADVGQGIFQGKTADDVVIMTQAIAGVWLVSPGWLLAEIVHMACDTLPGDDCYGFYEFALIDTATGSRSTLLDVDYHHRAAGEWTGCGPRILIDTVLPNPGQDKFAFTIKPVGHCYSFQNASYGYILDYSQPSAQLTPIPFADGLSWSPDGVMLAYATKDACRDSVCTASIQVLDASAGSEAVILNSAELYHVTPLFTTWSDERTVIYEWRDTASSEVPIFLVWQDALDGGLTPTAVSQAFFSNSVYGLGKAQPTLVGLSYPVRALIALTTKNEAAVRQIASEVGQVFYNSRYNDYLIVADRQLQSATVIDANLDMQDLPLADLFAAHPDERIVCLSPGT